MPETRVLVVSRDASLVGWIEGEIERLKGLRMDAVDDVEAACASAMGGGVGLLLVHLDALGEPSEVSRLLWASSTLRRPVSVLAIGERYEVERGTTLFQLGVADYLSRSHHRDCLGDVIEALVVRPSVESAEPVGAARGPEPRVLSGVS